jgi:hypothetical protein
MFSDERCRHTEGDMISLRANFKRFGPKGILMKQEFIQEAILCPSASSHISTGPYVPSLKYVQRKGKGIV